MEAVDEKRYTQIQGYEFEFWQNNIVDFQVLWGHYLPPFVRHLDKQCGVVVDVGSGPMPFFLSGYFEYEQAIAVDPLIFEYAFLPRYAPMYDGFKMMSRIENVENGLADTVFALNVLDHVRDPSAFVGELGRICKPGGKLFLFVDVDKPPDHMHPHTISHREVAGMFKHDFEAIETHWQHSWKFDSDCLWLVGSRKEAL